MKSLLPNPIILKKRFSRGNVVLLGIVSIFLVLRLGLLLTSVRFLYWFDEFYRGAVSMEILRGIHGSLWDYQADAYDGGSLVVSLLAVPFFKWLGPSLFSLKMVPLCFSTGTLIILFHFLRRNFGLREAVFGVLLFIFAPPLVVKHGLAAIGSHTESIFFSVLMFDLMYRYFFSETKQLRHVLCAAFVAGVGFWFTSMTGLAVAALFIAGFLLTPRRLFLRHLGVAVPFFAIGALPWIFYNLTHRHEAFDFIYFAFNPSNQSPLTQLLEAGPRAFKLLFLSFPVSGCFPDFFISGKWISVLYGAGLLLSVVFGTYVIFRERGDSKRRFSKILPALMYLGIYLLAFSLSQYSVDMPYSQRWIVFRYLTPFYFFCFIVAACGTYKSYLNRSMVFGLILCGVVAQGQMIGRGVPGAIFKIQGYSYYLMGDFFAGKTTSFMELWASVPDRTRGMTESNQQALIKGIMKGLRSAQPADLHGRGELIYKKLKPEWRTSFLRTWGELCGNSMGDHPEACMKYADAVDSRDRKYFLKGLADCSFYDWHSDEAVDSYIQRARHYPKDILKYVWRSFGVHFYELSVESDDMNESAFMKVWAILWETFTAEEAHEFAKGLGKAFAWDYYTRGEHPTLMALRLPDILSEPYRKDFYYGIGWRFRTIRPSGGALLATQIFDFPEAYRSFLRQGFRDAHKEGRLVSQLPAELTAS